MARSLQEALALALNGGEPKAQTPIPPGPNAAQNSRIYSSKHDPRKWSHRLSRHARGYGTAWDKLRKEVMTRDKRLCQPCLKDDRVTAAHAVDHIIQKASGGTDDLSNLQAICRACHLDKTMRDNGKRRKRGCAPDGWPLP